MTSFKRLQSFLLVVLALIVSSGSANAWHYGFPGYPPGWPRHSGWGGYGNIGFSATTRVRYRPGFYRSVHRSYYSPIYRHGLYRPYFSSFYYSPSLSFYSYRPSYYRTYIPVVSPVIYQSYRVSVPACVSTTPLIVPSIQATPSVPQYFQTNSSPVVVPAAAIATSPAGSATAAPQAIPTELLNVADALCRIGGYPEAAEAYGRLATRYNAAEALYARRFVAQLLSNNIEQAVTIAGSAEFSGFAIDQSGLPERSLTKLGIDTELETSISERLAGYALERSGDPDVFQALSTWFTLVGDAPRSELFLARSSQLRSRPSPSPLTADSDTRFVSKNEQ